MFDDSTGKAWLRLVCMMGTEAVQLLECNFIITQHACSYKLLCSAGCSSCSHTSRTPWLPSGPCSSSSGPTPGSCWCTVRRLTFPWYKVCCSVVLIVWCVEYSVVHIVQCCIVDKIEMVPVHLCDQVQTCHCFSINSPPPSHLTTAPPTAAARLPLLVWPLYTVDEVTSEEWW